jgi:hypothetical protein
VIAVGAIVLLFAIVGVATAGKYVADRASGAKTPTPVAVANNSSTTALTAISRAHEQATAIVKAARQNGRAIVSQAASKARHQASQIITQAHRTAASAPARSVPGTPSSAPALPTAAPVVVQPTAYVATSSQVTTGTTTGVTATTPLPVLQNTPVGAPNLSGVPASWLVVGYNPTFGSGPGSAGSVGVVNRGSKPFSGTVKVVYTHGGVATAPFSGLAPGASLILPLNGPTYPGGGFTIQVVV